MIRIPLGAVSASVSALAGLAVLGSLLLREPEEARVQSFLESSWIRLDDARQKWWPASLLALQQMSRKFSEFIDGQFGPSLTSIRAFSVSVCGSLLVSGVILVWQGCACGQRASRAEALTRLAIFAVILAALVINRKRQDGVASTAVVVALCLFAVWRRPEHAPFVPFVLGSVYLIAVVVVRFQRRCFQQTGNASSWQDLLSGVGNTLCVVFISVVPPLIVAREMLQFRSLARFAPSVGVVGTMNIGTAILPAVYLLCVLSVAANRIVWFLFDRPLYALQRTHVFEGRRTRAAVGFALLGPVLWQLMRGLATRILG
jgi:hypothetical protein